MTLPITLEGEARTKQRIEMISLALEEKAPKTFKKMKQEGELPMFLKNQEKMLMETYQREWSEILFSMESNQKKKENPLEQHQRIEMELKTLWEQTLETYLEFSDPTIQ